MTPPAERPAAVPAPAPLRHFQHRLGPGECAYCDAHRRDPMMPSHTASEHCRSGKRNHCTCDTCF